MSAVKGRRRNQKKFMDKEEENEIGVMDESNIEYKNKIEEKQEDMFDPHKLQQNILQNSEKSYQSNFIDFGDEEIVEEEQRGEKKEEREEREEEKKEEAKKERKRGKREKREKKAIINSDEDITENEPSKLEQQSEVTVEENSNVFRRQESEDKKEYQEQEESEEDAPNEQEAMEQIVRQKNQAQKPSQNYVLMHTILGKAGFNKHERRTAIYTPLQPGEHSFVFFKRYQSGFSEFYQAMGEDQRPILFCENQRGCIGCNYYISLTKEMDKNNPSYLGKLRGNAAGSIYQLYDNGSQPGNEMNRSKFRVSMAYIEYESNFLGMKGPRKLKAVIPNVKEVEDFDMYKLTEEECLNTFQPPTVIQLRNKQPRWNDRLKSYALNFGGRVKQASIKNFILMDNSYDQNEQATAPNLIVFGKIDENTFALQFRHPLNLFQAFGIAMSQFDFKLKCE